MLTLLYSSDRDYFWINWYFKKKQMILCYTWWYCNLEAVISQRNENLHSILKIIMNSQMFLENVIKFMKFKLKLWYYFIREIDKRLSSIIFVWMNIYYMCLSKLNNLWQSSELKFASKVALRCQALSLSKRLSLWSEWVRQKRVSDWILRDEETERDDERNRRKNALFIFFSLLNLLVF